MDLCMFIYQICTLFNLRKINNIYPAALDIDPIIPATQLYDVINMINIKMQKIGT